jgi:hypothetical protein
LAVDWVAVDSRIEAQANVHTMCRPGVPF